MSNLDVSFSVLCNQRRLQMLFTTPPVRFTPNNPYVDNPQYTKQQFDMRRKAEILKYRNPTQSNGLTKAQRWAAIASGKSQSNSYPDITLTQKNIDSNKIVSYTTIVVKYPDYYTFTYDASHGLFVYSIVPNGRLCSQDLLIPTPTSSSDVPGPLMNLYYDANVPLYNYNIYRDYGILNNNTNNLAWSVISDDNTMVSNTSETSVMYLYIQNGINSNAYLFSIDIPIAMYINANYNGTNNSMTNDFLVTTTLNINQPNILIYYNDLLVNTTALSQPIYTINGQQIGNGISSFMFDVSFNSSYQAIYNVGILTISNLFLYTQPGYIYDFHLICSIDAPVTQNLDYVSSFSSIYTTTNSGIFFNYNPITSATTYGCNIITSQYPLTQTGINISGVPQG